MALALVLLEPVRSAEPPTISGSAAVKTSIAFSDATRVAISFGAGSFAAASVSLNACTVSASFSAVTSARRLVDRRDQRKRPVGRDAVAVEHYDQPVELEVPGKRDRLLADAFHEVAVGREHVGAVVDDLAAEFGCEVAFRDCHPDRIGEP